MSMAAKCSYTSSAHAATNLHSLGPSAHSAIRGRCPAIADAATAMRSTVLLRRWHSAGMRCDQALASARAR